MDGSIDNEQTRTRRSDRRLDLAIAALLLAIVAPFVQTVTAQGASRYALTAALVEQGTVRIDAYEALLTVDRVDVDGHVYSDKAPGQPYLGVPILLAAEAIGADEATDTRFRGNLGVWSQTLFFCSIPAAVLLVLMRRFTRRTESADLALLAALGFSFGTLLLPMASALYAHVFVATLTFGAWCILSRPDPMRHATLVSAALCTVSTLSEYPMVGVALVLAAYAGWRYGWRAGLGIVAGQVLALVVLQVHNRLVYGAFGTGYSVSGRGPIGVPRWDNAWQIFLGAKGLVFTPLVLMGLAGIVFGLRRCRRPDLMVAAAMFAGMFVLQAGWSNPWGGEAPGPRYLTPILPFLAAPAAMALRGLSSRFRTIVVLVGVVTMGLAIITLPLVAPGSALIEGHVANIRNFGVNPTVFTLAMGGAGWTVHLMLVALAAGWTAREFRLSSPRPLPASGP